MGEKSAVIPCFILINPNFWGFLSLIGIQDFWLENLKLVPVWFKTPKLTLVVSAMPSAKQHGLKASPLTEGNAKAYRFAYPLGYGVLVYIFDT